MATQLLTDDEGRNAIKVAQQFLLKERLSRFFKRNLALSYEEWKAGGGFNLSTTLDDLNGVNDQEIRELYRLLSVAGGLPSTIADLEVYIDSVNGSDETGDGSSGNPYASMWFLDNLPSKINHVVDILFTQDYTHTDHINLGFEFGPNGYLNFIGVGTPTILQANLEVDTTTAMDENLAQHTSMYNAFGDDYSNEFLMFTENLNAGKAQAIHSFRSTKAVITVLGSFSGIAQHDHADVVQPKIKLSALSVTCDCRVANSYTAILKEEAKLAFFNLRIEVGQSAPNGNWDGFLVQNSCPMAMSFCQILRSGAAYSLRVRIAQGSELNTQNGREASAAKAASGIQNLVTFGSTLMIAGLTLTDNTAEVICEGTLEHISTRGEIYIHKTAMLNWVTSGQFIAENAIAKIQNCLCQGRVATGLGGGIEIDNSKLSIDGFSAINTDNVFSIYKNSDLILSRCGLDSTYTTAAAYGIHFSGIGRVQLDDAGTRLTGSSDAIYFATVAAPFAEHVPAAYGFVSDNIGPTPPTTPDECFFSSFVKRMST